MKEYNDLHEAQWAFREIMKELWPIPDPSDSASYAIQEIGEALDAEMRQRRRDHNRNNVRYVSVTDELADCWIMLSTMHGTDPMHQLFTEAGESFRLPFVALKLIARLVTEAAMQEAFGEEDWPFAVQEAADTVDLYFSLNVSDTTLSKVVCSRLWRIFWKRTSENEFGMDEGTGKLHDRVTAVIGPWAGGDE